MEIVAQEQTEVKQQGRVSRGARKVGGFMRRRKKMLILGGMFVLLIVTGYLNWALNSSTPEVGGGGGGGAGAGYQQHMMVTFRQVRDAERTSLMRALEFISTAESGFTAQAQAQAAQQKLDLIAATTFEVNAEGMIVALGFQDAVVQKNGDNINVIVRNPENITQEQATKIQTTLEHIAGRDLLDYIHIRFVA